MNIKLIIKYFIFFNSFILFDSALYAQGTLDQGIQLLQGLIEQNRNFHKVLWVLVGISFFLSIYLTKIGKQLGKYVVRSIYIALDFVGILTILSAIYLGWTNGPLLMPENQFLGSILAAIFGGIISFVFVILIFGIFYIILEINAGIYRNEEKLDELIEKTNDAKI